MPITINDCVKCGDIPTITGDRWQRGIGCERCIAKDESSWIWEADSDTFIELVAEWNELQDVSGAMKTAQVNK